MKVTICFDDVKIIVPCTSTCNPLINKRLSIGRNSIEDFSINNNNYNNNERSYLKVIDVIENAIARYKKATAKVGPFYYLILNTRVSY